jgi:hypothetical protein
MNEHHIETTLREDGILTLTGLPFRAGDAVEVIILPRPQKSDELLAPREACTIHRSD